MSLKRFLIVVTFSLSIIIFTQCTSRYSQISSDEEVLSPLFAKAKTSPISMQIPIGWSEIDANDSTFIDLWLVSDDFKSSLSLIPLHSEGKNQSLDEWKVISKLTNKMKFKDVGVQFIDEEDIEVNDNRVVLYSFEQKNLFYRVSIFEHQNKFYELTALEENKSNRVRLFNIQNAVLSSIN